MESASTPARVAAPLDAYAVVPDGIKVERGVMGRAVRLGRAQLATDVRSDPDYVAALPGIGSELAVPLRAGRVVVGALNIESERALPDGAAALVRPLASALAPVAEALRASRSLDHAGLARLFVHLGCSTLVGREGGPCGRAPSSGFRCVRTGRSSALS